MSPMPLGILAAAGGAGGEAFELIAEGSLSGAEIIQVATSSEYEHYMLLMKYQINSNYSHYPRFTINNYVGGGYDRHDLGRISGTDQAQYQSRDSSNQNFGPMTGLNYEQDIDGMFLQMNFANHTASNKAAVGQTAATMSVNDTGISWKYRPNHDITGLATEFRLSGAPSYNYKSRFEIYGIRGQ